MDDCKIIDLFFLRNEQALEETKRKYGNYCKKIAFQILNTKEDVEECENDTYMKLWASIPPTIPNSLKVYIATLARNLSIQKYRYYHANKRNQHMETVLDEIEESVSAIETVETEIAKKELVEAINCFLSQQTVETRKIFIRRYWKLEPIQVICKEMNLSKSKVETNLSRVRKKLKVYLEQEGYVI